MINCKKLKWIFSEIVIVSVILFIGGLIANHIDLIRPIYFGQYSLFYFMENVLQIKLRTHNVLLAFSVIYLYFFLLSCVIIVLIHAIISLARLLRKRYITHDEEK